MALEVEDLRFHHPGQTRPFIAVERFHLEAGERVLIHGPSGCGKSTLLSLITGIRPLQRGRIRVADGPFSELSQRRRDAFRADHIGVIFQAFNLLPYLSALDNVRLTPAFSKRRRQREGRADTSDTADKAGKRAPPWPCWAGWAWIRRWRGCPPINCPLASSSAWRRPGRSTANRS